MIQDLKGLVVVLGLTLPIWYFAKRFFAPFSAPGDFERRRNVWLFLTVLGLLAPSIWIYALFALPAAYWAGKRDSNPIALYLLLFYVVPNASIPLPSIIVNELFDISNQRLLALAIVLPAALRFRRERFSQIGAHPVAVRRLDSADWLLIAYLALTVILPSPHHSITHTLRQTVLALLDVGLLFAVWSRLTPRLDVLKDCLAAWVLAALMLSAVAMFEAARTWLLYVPISNRWGDPNLFAFLLRGGQLRAQASTGHSLTLGIWLATAWTFFLFVRAAWTSRLAKLLVGSILLGGLAATLARGAWIAAFLSTLVFYLLATRGLAAKAKALTGVSVLLGLFSLTPFGARIISMLPFVGTTETENVDYRRRLLEVSMDLIKVNPWFGDPFVLNQMESLRQGQGIIDLVNGYLYIALFNGLVGLGIFVAFIGVCAARGWSAWRRYRRTEPEHAQMGAALLAVMTGNLLFIATAFVDPMTYMLAGLLICYWLMSRNAVPRRQNQLFTKAGMESGPLAAAKSRLGADDSVS